MSTPILPLHGSTLPIYSLEDIPEPPDYESLVTEDDTPVDNLYSERQFSLLRDPLYASWPGPGDGKPFIVVANVALFYQDHVPPIVPDVMLSLGVQMPTEFKQKKHRSYFIYEFGKPPDVAIEVVSNLVGAELDTKLGIYAKIGVPYYVIWDPSDYLKVERLRVLVRRGTFYEPMDKPWFPEVGLGVTLWDGEFQGINAQWLRWCDNEGQILPWGKKRAEQEKSRAEQEKSRAEQEKSRAEQAESRAVEAKDRAEQAENRAAQAESRADQLAAQLRALGIEPKS